MDEYVMRKRWKAKREEKLDEIFWDTGGRVTVEIVFVL